MLWVTLDPSGMFSRDVICSPLLLFFLIGFALLAAVFCFRDKAEIFHLSVFLLDSLIQYVGSVRLMLTLVRTTLF